MPSGASTGEFEATELRDGGSDWMGKGVTRAVENVNGEIATAVRGQDASSQAALDRMLIHTGRHAQQVPPRCQRDPRRLARGGPRCLGRGAPAAVAVSGRRGAHVLPVPMMNVLNGGAHADNKVDFRSSWSYPSASRTFAEALKMGDEVFQAPQAEPGRTRASRRP